MKSLIVSLHDFHPGSRELIAEQIQELSALGVDHFSILVIPQYHHGKRTCDDAASLAYLNQRHAAGDDLVLHGHYHDRRGNKGGSFFLTQLYTANEAEFLDLSDGEFMHRIELGSKLWAQQDWGLHGFIAPGWLMPSVQDKLLKRMGIDYTTRLSEFTQIQKNNRKKSQSLCYSTRSSWRRSVSSYWNPFLFSSLRRTDMVRLSLHPHDFAWPLLKQQIKEILQMALADGFQPITYRDYAKM